MKQQFKKSYIFITIVLLILAIMCVTNVTYSYFTATKSKDESINFGDLNVQFVYSRSGFELEETTTSSGKIELYSASGPIVFGELFDLGVAVKQGESTTIQTIDSIAVKNLDNSSDCYVRFWITAYIVESGVVNTSKDYGKYFFWEESVNPLLQSFVRSTSEDSCYYYFKESLVANSQNSIIIENSLKLQDVSEDDKAPVEILGEQLKITLNLQAVQKANGAYVTVFGDDDSGCYDWENKL